jgi:excisionase family DNA binding protein
MVPSSHSWRGPQLFTVPEACSLLKIGRTKFYDGVRRGTIKVVRLDGCTRISSTEIERIIESHTQQAAA